MFCEKIKPPTYCFIALLESCFFKCRMCYKWKTDINARDPQEPSLAQWKDFISSLKGFVRDGCQINFAGGEPLARKETLELINFAYKNSFSTLLATNGYLINEDMARQIGNSGLTTISISLDSITAKRHDYIRGINGAFERVMQAIDYLDKYAGNVKVGINSIIMEENLEEIWVLVEWAQNNAKISYVSFQAITQPFSTLEESAWYMNNQYSHLWPKDIVRVDKVLDSLIKMKKDGFSKLGNPVSQFYVYKAYFRSPCNFVKKQKCHIDLQAINVDPNGEVRLCCYMEPIGNIKSDNIRDIWFSKKANARKQAIANCKKNCQSMVNCNYDEKELYLLSG